MSNQNYWLSEAQTLVKHTSVTHDGNEAIANLWLERLKARGLHAQLQWVTHSIEGLSKRQFNVLSTLGDPLVDRKIKKGLLLLCPLDTPPAGLKSNWVETRGNPLEVHLKDGKIYGLGVSDSKLDFLCRLIAAERFVEKKLKQPIYLVGTAASGLNGLGSRYLVESGAVNPLYVLTSTPSDLQIVNHSKSSLPLRIQLSFQSTLRDVRGFTRKIRLISFGKSTCASSPEKGVHSTDQLFELIQAAAEQGFEMKVSRIQGGEIAHKIPDRSEMEFFLTSHQAEDFKSFFQEFTSQTGLSSSFHMEASTSSDNGTEFVPDATLSILLQLREMLKQFQKNLEERKSPEFNPRFTTLVWTTILPSSQHYSLDIDARILPGQDTNKILQDLQQKVSDITRNYRHFNIKVQKLKNTPEYDLPDTNPWVDLCQNTLKESGVSKGTKSSSWFQEASLWSHAGYDAVAFGPGSMCHEADEHVEIAALDKAVAFYEKLISKVCL